MLMFNSEFVLTIKLIIEAYFNNSPENCPVTNWEVFKTVTTREIKQKATYFEKEKKPLMS